MNKLDLKEAGLDQVFPLIKDIFKPFHRILSYGSLVLCPFVSLFADLEKMDNIRKFLEDGCDPAIKEKHPEK